MISAIQRQEDGTIRLTVTVPFDAVKKTWDEVIEEVAKEIEVPGFRIGKAPRHLVEEKIDKEKVREEALKKLLPKFYIDAVQEHNLRPIINPKIHIEKLEDPQTLSESKGWQFTALTCESPEVKLNNYKQNIQKITAAATFDVAKSKIIVPGEPFDPSTPFRAKGRREVKLEDVVRALLESVSTTIPQVLIDQEVERLLAQTLDDIKRLGLTLDQYLSSTNKTPEALRDEYKQKVINDLRLEFALQKIASDEKIMVNEKEIEEAIQKAKDEKERKHLEGNRYLLASILRQQKTLDFLKNL
jgi:FKBP-type peptidyl-prolyl cis-trans isomerase (trigger factor)